VHDQNETTTLPLSESLHGTGRRNLAPIPSEDSFPVVDSPWMCLGYRGAMNVVEEPSKIEDISITTDTISFE
jgi:hypothetical protein